MLRFFVIERPTTQTRAVARDGGVDDLLQPVDVRREGGHDHAPRRLADDALRLSATIASEGVEPAARRSSSRRGAAPRRASPTAAEAVQLGAPPVDRRVVDLDVAGVDDRALRRVQHDGDGVRDRVRDADELGRGTARPGRCPSPGSISRSSAARIRPCSSSFDLIEAEREARRPHLAARRPRGSGTAGRRRGPRGRASGSRPGRGSRLLAQVARSRAARGRRRASRRAGRRCRRRSATMPSSHSTTVMFLPISPMPAERDHAGPTPVAVIRAAEQARGRSSAVAHDVALGLGGGDERQPRVADREAEQLHRGLAPGSGSPSPTSAS